MDTDMEAAVPAGHKVDPAEVARLALDAEVLGDDLTRRVTAGLAQKPEQSR